MTFPPSTVARARKGAELLDRHLPGWPRHVRIELVNTESTRDCVLGQLTRNDPRVLAYMCSVMHRQLALASRDSYHGAAMMLSGSVPWPSREWLHDHGFSGSVWATVKPRSPLRVNLLDNAWVQEMALRGRRGRGRPPTILDASLVS